MRATDNRFPLLAAILVALLFATMPGSVQAQAAQDFDVAGCTQGNRDALTQRAQAKSMAVSQTFASVTNPSMKLVYCWDRIKSVFSTIGNLTSGASTFGSMIWNLVLQAIEGLLNQVCQAVVGAITSAINMMKNLICLPLPHFNLGASFSIGSFGAGTCNGVSLLSLGAGGASRPRTPYGYSPLWNYTPR